MKEARLLLLLFIISLRAYSKDNPLGSLPGRWTYVEGGSKNALDVDFIFNNDNTGLVTSSNGRILLEIKYQTSVLKDIVKLSYTIKGNTSRVHFNLRFENDSTLHISHGNLDIKSDKRRSKKIMTFRKVKVPDTANVVHPPSYLDLLGHWALFLNGKTYEHMNFIDESRVDVSYPDGRLVKITYKVDFTKVPATLDFNYPDRDQPLQALIQFWQGNRLWVETFPENNRKNKFHTFGHNSLYVRTETK